MSDLDAFVDAARSGGGWAFGRLWSELSPAVCAYLRGRKVPDPEDVASEVFLAAFCGIDRFSGDGTSFRTWLFTIAHHKSVDATRRAARRAIPFVGLAGRADSADDIAERVTQPQRSAEDEALEGMSGDAALEILDRLSDSQRAVLLLRIIGELSVSETAAVLGRPPGAVKVAQHRALRRLRAELADHPRRTADVDPVSDAP
jgi:RNA polymerase sigma-70 factor (ECF subfamily)